MTESTDKKTTKKLSTPRQFFKRKVKHAADSSVQSARRSMLQELFNDFNTNRWQIYRLNFVRGIFFGLGSVLGGTIVVAIVVWILSGLAQNIDNQGLSDFFNALSRAISTNE